MIVSVNLLGTGITDIYAVVVRNVIGHYFVSARKGVQPANEGQTGYVDVRGNHSAIVRSNGAASLVLLKNIRNALPLSKPRIMALFGQNAGPIMAGPNDVFNVLGSGPTYAGVRPCFYFYFRNSPIIDSERN